MSIVSYFKNIKNMQIWHLPLFIVLAIVSFIITHHHPKIGVIVTPVFYYGTAFGLLYQDLYHKRTKNNETISQSDYKAIAIKCLPFAIVGFVYSLIFLLVPFLEKSPVTRIVGILERSPLGIIIPTIYCLISLIGLEASQS